MSAVKHNLHLKDFHRAHKKRKHRPEDTATLKQYTEIVEVMGDILGDELIKKGSIQMPGIKWNFRITKSKRPYYVDRKASKEQGCEVLAANDHSDGFVCMIEIDKTVLQYSSVQRKLLYIFKPNRNLKREKLNNYIRYNKAVIYNYETINNKE